MKYGISTKISKTGVDQKLTTLTAVVGLVPLKQVIAESERSLSCIFKNFVSTVTLLLHKVSEKLALTSHKSSHKRCF